MDKRPQSKVSIIGCGNVGMRYAYALVIKGIARRIVMVDRNTKRLEGDMMDLSHTAPYVQPVELVAGDYPDTKDSDLVVITAGASQKPGQTRVDLVNDNVKIFKSIIPNVIKYNPDAILLIVTNPVDTLSYAAYRIAGKPSQQIIGSGTVLDTARFRSLIGSHCNVDSHNVHAYILGEHGDSEFPVWSSAMIGGVLFKDYCMICKKRSSCKGDNFRNKVFEEVRDSAYKIIDRKGETSYGIGLALARITRAIIDDENSVLPVSSLAHGYMGLDDVYLSLPAIINRHGVESVLNISLEDNEKQAMHNSAQAIKAVIKKVGL
ncbi:MAG: L-lactate dehydrogenase [Elusimicrobia bacterium]|nr:L-lactate dehydrogenase [Elusimicrobiota bacterium]MBD3412179.1 L-lactate dehydrogenase [Elusimicrobiota bacterium]